MKYFFCFFPKTASGETCLKAGQKSCKNLNKLILKRGKGGGCEVRTSVLMRLKDRDEVGWAENVGKLCIVVPMNSLEEDEASYRSKWNTGKLCIVNGWAKDHFNRRR